MVDATDDAKEPPLRVAFDRHLKLEFHGARMTADGGLLAYRVLDDALGLTAVVASTFGPPWWRRPSLKDGAARTFVAG
jgi:hypothetical protein